MRDRSSDHRRRGKARVTISLPSVDRIRCARRAAIPGEDPGAAIWFGYPIYWAFLYGAATARHTARDALAPQLDDDVTFGTFNPREDTLSLGDAVTVETDRVPVESAKAFQYSDVLGYRAGASATEKVKPESRVAP